MLPFVPGYNLHMHHALTFYIVLGESVLAILVYKVSVFTILVYTDIVLSTLLVYNESCGVKLKLRFKPLMVIYPTASWIRWCIQVYAGVHVGVVS